MWLFSRKGASGFSAASTAEEVTQGIDGSALTAIVTGASSGIGAETSRVLALRGVHVIMAVRNLSTGNEVKEEIIKEVPNAKIDAVELDLSSITSIKNFASNFNSSGLPLNILINNAGVMASPFMLSKDNIELQFATNHVGHFLLTNLVLETMKKTARESSQEGRIVNVSSRRHKSSYPEGIRFDKINDQSGYGSLSAYGQSKLANVLHANELARHLKEEKVDITANSLHPGAIATNLFRYHSFVEGLVAAIGKHVMKNVQQSNSLAFVKLCNRSLCFPSAELIFNCARICDMFTWNAWQGAATTCYVALHPDVKGVTGRYYANSNLAETSLQAKDSEMAKKLWDFTQNLIYQCEV